MRAAHRTLTACTARAGASRWTITALIVVVVAAAVAARGFLRLRAEAREERAGASMLAAALEHMIEEAELERLAGAQPDALRAAALESESLVAAGAYDAAPAEELALRTQVGAALTAVGESARAIALLEAVERDVVARRAAGRSAWEEYVLGANALKPDALARVREELARAWRAEGELEKALALAEAALADSMHDGQPSAIGAPLARRWLLAGVLHSDLEHAQDGERCLRETLRHADGSGRESALVRSAALAKQSDLEEAIVLRREALTVLDQRLAEDDLRVALRRYELAYVVHDLGPRAHEEARELYAVALEPRRAAMRGDTMGFASHLSNYALLLKQMRRSAEAEPLATEALAMRRRMRPEDDAGTATMLNNLGTLRLELGREAEAEAAHLEALAMRRRLFPEGDADLAQSLQNLAWLRQNQEKYEEARDLSREAVDVLRRIGADELDLAIALDNLGSAHLDLDEYVEAERLAREALAIERRVLHGEHLTTAQTLENLGVALYRLDRNEEAAAHFTECLAIRRALYGDGRPEVATALWFRARIHRDAGRYEEAERDFAAAVTIQRDTDGDHVDLAIMQDERADCMFATDPGRAFDLFREAIDTAIAELPKSAETLANAAEGMSISTVKSQRLFDGEKTLAQAAREVFAEDSVDEAVRERVVEALCLVLHTRAGAASTDAEDYLQQAEAWRLRLHPPAPR